MGGSLKRRVVAGVSTLWILVALVWGSQTALAATLQGNPFPLGPAIRSALIQSLPWIPGTLAVVWLAARYPVSRGTWRDNLWRHLLALPLVTFGVELLVVLGFWISAGNFEGLPALLRGGLLWTTLRIHVAVVIYAAIAALTQGVMVFQEIRGRELRMARLEGQLAKARLQALNAQIRPHFLFNTLHTIGQLWRSGRSEDADAMLDHLGSLFQKVQSTASHAEVPLADELKMVEEYLAIEEARFRDRLHSTVQASPEALRCLVPPLVLQPLVENAIRHGISVSSTAGRVAVEAWVSDGRLTVEVRDDGPGMNHPSPTPGNGTGLSNTRERLEQAYGDNQRLDVLSPPKGGTTIRIEVAAHV